MVFILMAGLETGGVISVAGRTGTACAAVDRLVIHCVADGVATAGVVVQRSAGAGSMAFSAGAVDYGDVLIVIVISGRIMAAVTDCRTRHFVAYSVIHVHCVG